MGNLRKLMTEEFGGISKWWLFACLYWNGSFSGATRRRSRPRTLPRRLRSPRPTTSCSHRPARPRLPPPSGSSSKSLETMLFIVNEADFEIRKCRIELKRQAFAEWSDISTSQNKPASARRVENLKWPAECEIWQFWELSSFLQLYPKINQQKNAFYNALFSAIEFWKARGWYLFLFRNILQLLLFQALCRLEWMEEGKWFEQHFSMPSHQDISLSLWTAFMKTQDRHFLIDQFQNERGNEPVQRVRRELRLGCGCLRQLHADRKCGDQRVCPGGSGTEKRQLWKCENNVYHLPFFCGEYWIFSFIFFTRKAN